MPYPIPFTTMAYKLLTDHTSHYPLPSVAHPPTALWLGYPLKPGKQSYAKESPPSSATLRRPTPNFRPCLCRQCSNLFRSCPCCQYANLSLSLLTASPPQRATLHFSTILAQKSCTPMSFTGSTISRTNHPNTPSAFLTISSNPLIAGSASCHAPKLQPWLRSWQFNTLQLKPIPEHQPPAEQHPPQN